MDVVRARVPVIGVVTCFLRLKISTVYRHTVLAEPATAAAWCNAIQQDREPPVTPYPYHGCHSTDDRSVCMPMRQAGCDLAQGA